MDARNLAWAASNESRFFPFDDSAQLIDDKGQRPPLQLLADMKLMVPESAGRYLYVGAVSITPLLVTSIIMVADTLDEPGSPAATISERLPITRHYPYSLLPQIDGVGGWISFGDLIDLTYQGRFTLPRQSLLSPLAARSYRTPPISSVRSVGGAQLSGLVKLLGGNDIEIVRECREVPAHAVAIYHEGYCGTDELGTQVRDVVVVRLKDKTEQAGRNVFDLYKGLCGKRPASRTCGSPEPIEFIGATGPDCNGNIDIKLLGCLDALAINELVTLDDMAEPVFSEEATGVVLACGLGLVDACLSSEALPDSEGRLPGELDDICEEISLTSISEGSTDSVPAFEFDEEDAADAFAESISEDFDEIGDWVIHFGAFNQVSDVLVAGSLSRNVATYEPVDAPTGFYRTALARVQLVADPIGSLHNAAVVANYADGYFVAEIDWDGHYRGFKQFRIARFDGSSWLNLFSVAASSLQLGHYYEIELSVYPHEDIGDAWLVGTLTGITDPGVAIEIGPLSVSGYGDGSGFFGVGTNRSASRFTSFRVESILSPP